MRAVAAAIATVIIAITVTAAVPAFAEDRDARDGIPSRGTPRVLAAQFELDAEPVGWLSPRRWLFRLFCAEAGAVDAITVVLSHEIDESTLRSRGRQFVVHTRLGRRLKPNCSRLRPADEENEDRSVQLYGDFGSATDPPERVEITGALLTEPDVNGHAHNLLGLQSPALQSPTVGPVLLLAEILSAEEVEHSDRPDEENCPRARTAQVLRVVWSGAVSQRAHRRRSWPRGAGEELGAAQYARIHIALQKLDETTEIVSPFYVGDRDDEDNNNDLCLEFEGAPLRVEVEANTVTNRAGVWNPLTRISLSN